VTHALSTGWLSQQEIMASYDNLRATEDYVSTFHPVEVERIMEFARHVFPDARVIHYQMTAPMHSVPIARDPSFPHEIETMVIVAKSERYDPVNDGVVNHICRYITDTCIDLSDEPPRVVVVGLKEYGVQTNVMTGERMGYLRWALGTIR